MEDNCSSALVHFYQAACTFQITKYRNSLERVAVCRDIFDRYISRNSDDLIGLPENIRAEIVAGVTNAPSYLFRNAAEITFQYMHDVHWNRFKQIVYEKAVRDTNIFQEDKLGASANAAVANSELDMHSASAASTLALQATEDNDMHNNLLNITNGSAASLSTQEESALVSASTAAACNKSDVDDEEFGKPKIKHGSKLVFPDKGPTSTVLKQQRELLERQKPPHTEKFADFAKMAFPGDSNGTIASDSASVSDSMSNARLLALEAAAYGITTPVAPVEEKYSKGGFLSNLFRAMTGSGSSSSSSKSGVTGTGTQHNKNSSVVPSKSVITNTNTSKTVIPVLSDSMGGENIRHVSNENNLKGGAGAGDSMTTPDSGTSEVFSLADMLKENCQQARRRSLAHAPDPFFLAADATKNSHSQSHSNSNSNSNSNGDSNGHEKSISHKGASMRIEEKSGTATATATASASASATATATANVAATAATVSGSANTLAAVALASMDSEEKRLTLLSILGHSQCCAVFKSHLEITGSSQTLLFLVELEDYLCIPNPSFQRIRAKKIYGKYMHALSIMPVPVSASTRQSVLEKIQTAGPALFKQAHNEVLEYIESCQLSGFLATSEWEEVKGVLKSKSSNSSNKSSNQSSSSHERNDNRSRKSFVIGSQSEILSDFKSLFNILHNQIATRYFKDFCHRIFVNESLFFWLDVENYIQLPGTDYMKRAALKISRKYIFDNAQQQINISHSTRTEILKALINPSRVLFKRAQQEIFKLLEQDALPKFIRSSEFKSMQETLQTAASIQQEKQGDGGGGGGFAVFGRSLSRLVSR